MFECIIFASGILVMILEMVGARLMAPYLGTSTIVWTALIGMILTFLAIGAWLGGRLADRRLSSRTLSAVLAGAGGGTALTALIHPLFGIRLMEACPNLYLGAVAASILYFTLPALLFGMVPPYVVRLRLADPASYGATVGRLYALSTAGSIVGTFLGGFVLVSWFRSTEILWGVAAAAGLLSLLAAARKNPPGLLLLLSGLGAAYAMHSYEDWQIRQGTLPTLETPYNTIKILEGISDDGRRVRLMRTDPGKFQSGMYLDDPGALYLHYTRYYALGPALHPGAERVLMLGGGGYSVPKWLLAGGGGLTKLRLDVVELDPGMTRLARSHFGLPEDPRLHILHEDARRFLNTNTQHYDLIFIDVFNSFYSIPFQMGTVEAAREMRRALAPGGMLMMNVISAFDGQDSALFQSILGAVRSAFPETHCFAVTSRDNLQEVQNLMILALPEKRPDLAAAFAVRDTRLPASIQNMLRTRITREPDRKFPPLTDEFAPVERYARALAR